eukprot:GHVT01005547.1.p1 GENE.GHVT01005547.1~~GHVT01005547.1.p1  ORF type:complete len:1355 (-),score=200.94 GHVT01005547.1:1332-5396(-)
MLNAKISKRPSTLLARAACILFAVNCVSGATVKTVQPLPVPFLMEDRSNCSATSVAASVFGDWFNDRIAGPDELWVGKDDQASVQVGEASFVAPGIPPAAVHRAVCGAFRDAFPASIQSMRSALECSAGAPNILELSVDLGGRQSSKAQALMQQAEATYIETITEALRLPRASSAHRPPVHSCSLRNIPLPRPKWYDAAALQSALPFAFQASNGPLPWFDLLASRASDLSNRIHQLVAEGHLMVNDTAMPLGLHRHYADNPLTSNDIRQTTSPCSSTKTPSINEIGTQTPKATSPPTTNQYALYHNHNFAASGSVVHGPNGISDVSLPAVAGARRLRGFVLPGPTYRTNLPNPWTLPRPPVLTPGAPVPAEVAADDSSYLKDDEDGHDSDKEEELPMVWSASSPTDLRELMPQLQLNVHESNRTGDLEIVILSEGHRRADARAVPSTVLLPASGRLARALNNAQTDRVNEVYPQYVDSQYVEDGAYPSVSAESLPNRSMLRVTLPEATTTLLDALETLGADAAVQALRDLIKGKPTSQAKTEYLPGSSYQADITTFDLPLGLPSKPPNAKGSMASQGRNKQSETSALGGAIAYGPAMRAGHLPPQGANLSSIIGLDDAAAVGDDAGPVKPGPGIDAASLILEALTDSMVDPIDVALADSPTQRPTATIDFNEFHLRLRTGTLGGSIHKPLSLSGRRYQEEQEAKMAAEAASKLAIHSKLATALLSKPLDVQPMPVYGELLIQDLETGQILYGPEPMLCPYARVSRAALDQARAARTPASSQSPALSASASPANVLTLMQSTTNSKGVAGTAVQGDQGAAALLVSFLVKTLGNNLVADAWNRPVITQKIIFSNFTQSSIGNSELLSASSVPSTLLTDPLTAFSSPAASSLVDSDAAAAAASSSPSLLADTLELDVVRSVPSTVGGGRRLSKQGLAAEEIKQGGMAVALVTSEEQPAVKAAPSRAQSKRHWGPIAEGFHTDECGADEDAFAVRWLGLSVHKTSNDSAGTDQSFTVPPQLLNTLQTALEKTLGLETGSLKLCGARASPLVTVFAPNLASAYLPAPTASRITESLKAALTRFFPNQTETHPKTRLEDSLPPTTTATAAVQFASTEFNSDHQAVLLRLLVDPAALLHAPASSLLQPQARAPPSSMPPVALLVPEDMRLKVDPLLESVLASAGIPIVHRPFSSGPSTPPSSELLAPPSECAESISSAACLRVRPPPMGKPGSAESHGFHSGGPIAWLWAYGAFCVGVAIVASAIAAVVWSKYRQEKDAAGNVIAAASDTPARLSPLYHSRQTQGATAATFACTPRTGHESRASPSYPVWVTPSYHAYNNHDTDFIPAVPPISVNVPKGKQ